MTNACRAVDDALDESDLLLLRVAYRLELPDARDPVPSRQIVRAALMAWLRRSSAH